MKGAQATRADQNPSPNLNLDPNLNPNLSPNLSPNPSPKPSPHPHPHPNQRTYDEKGAGLLDDDED